MKDNLEQSKRWMDRESDQMIERRRGNRDREREKERKSERERESE